MGEKSHAVAFLSLPMGGIYHEENSFIDNRVTLSFRASPGPGYFSDRL
jgi:hypothetical protein